MSYVEWNVKYIPRRRQYTYLLTKDYIGIPNYKTVENTPRYLHLPITSV